MNCLESHQLVQRFLDGESLGGARGEFDRHLLACPACRQLYSSAERLQMGLGLLSSPVSPASLAERIYGSLLNDYSRRQHRRLVVRYSALAASLLLAAVAGVYLF